MNLLGRIEREKRISYSCCCRKRACTQQQPAGWADNCFLASVSDVDCGLVVAYSATAFSITPVDLSMGNLYFTDTQRQ
jgi:hypothetical protein